MFRIIILSVGVPTTLCSHAWDMWRSPLLANPSGNDLEESQVSVSDADSDLGWMRPQISALREGLVAHISYYEQKIRERPAEVEIMRINLAERVRKYREIVGDCSGIDLSTVVVPASLVASFAKEANIEAKTKEVLTSQPKEVSCWLINDVIQKVHHKILIRENTGERMKRIIQACEESISEIDQLSTPEDFRSFHVETFGIFATNRGKWLVAMQRFAQSTARMEIIKAEFAAYRDTPVVDPKKKTSQGSAELIEHLWGITSLFMDNGGDSGLIRLVLDHGSTFLTRFHMIHVIKVVTERLNRKVSDLANIEVNLSYIVLGDSPIRKYRK